MLRRVNWFQSCHPLCCRHLSLDFGFLRQRQILPSSEFLSSDVCRLFSLSVEFYVSFLTKAPRSWEGLRVSCIRHHKQGMITQHFPFIATMCRFSPTWLVAVVVGHFDQHQSGVTHHRWLCLSVSARERGDGWQSETCDTFCSDAVWQIAHPVVFCHFMSAYLFFWFNSIH